MKFTRLTNENFLMYAIKQYNNPTCTGVDEFKKDMKHLTYISKILNKGSEASQQKHRLLLNHIIILKNLFDGEAVARILFFYFNPIHHGIIKASLNYISSLPQSIPEVDIGSIKSDENFSSFLRSI